MFSLYSLLKSHMNAREPDSPSPNPYKHDGKCLTLPNPRAIYIACQGECDCEPLMDHFDSRGCT
jgi:hypothetical protein